MIGSLANITTKIYYAFHGDTFNILIYYYHKSIKSS